MVREYRNPDKKKRLLFWGEDLALTHVVRPLMLANLMRDKYDIIFITGDRYVQLVESYGITPHKVWTLSNELFMERMRRGVDGWSGEEISRQVADEMVLIEELSPDW
jgi:UDP:flavonoid glycosyltransferase YjiC (YdhE family)